MTVEEIRAYCRKREWQPSLKRGSLDDPNFYPVWGQRISEQLESWHAIEDAYTSGPSFWLRSNSAVRVRRDDGKFQAVFSEGAVEVGRTQKDSPIYAQKLIVECAQCKALFHYQTKYGFRTVPQFCEDHRPVTASDFEDRSESLPRRTKPATTKAAVRETVEAFRELGDTALLADVIAAAIPKIDFGGRGRDNRAGNIRRELRTLRDVKMDKDQLIFI